MSVPAPHELAGCAAWGVLGFLLGSVPWGLLLLKLAGGPDPRTIGSGNIGATNVVRAGGKALGLLTLVLDAGKGLLPVVAAGAGTTWAAAGGLGAVLGHCFSPWLGWRGGKGVATFLGIAVVGGPWPPATFVAAWLATFAAFRISAIASVTAVILAALVAVNLSAFGHDGGWAGAAALSASAVVVALRHRSNFEKMLAERRARRGQEAGA